MRGRDGGADVPPLNGSLEDRIGMALRGDGRCSLLGPGGRASVTDGPGRDRTVLLIVNSVPGTPWDLDHAPGKLGYLGPRTDAAIELRRRIERRDAGTAARTIRCGRSSRRASGDGAEPRRLLQLVGAPRAPPLRRDLFKAGPEALCTWGEGEVGAPDVRTVYKTGLMILPLTLTASA